MRIRIDLAYDGTNFRGWAVQPGLRTIQGELSAALVTTLRVPRVGLVCAGRTDTGVHARGQVVHADVAPEDVESAAGRSAGPPLEALLRRVNGVLPLDVRVRGLAEAPPGFDARYSALWRRYAYRVADTPSAVDPLLRAQVLSWSRPLDLDALNQASAALLGRHDFASFCKLRKGGTTIRSLLDLTWARDPAGLAVATVRADAFCHSMVRAMVGCLLAVGDGRQPVTWAADILRAGVRDPGATVAPGRGLTLEEVAYPPDAELAARAARTRTKRVSTGSTTEDDDG